MPIRMHNSGCLQHNSRILTKSKGNKIEPYARRTYEYSFSEEEMCLSCERPECNGSVTRCRKRIQKVLFSEQNTIDNRIDTLTKAVNACDPDKQKIEIIEYLGRIDELRRLKHEFLRIWNSER